MAKEAVALTGATVFGGVVTNEEIVKSLKQIGMEGDDIYAFMRANGMEAEARIIEQQAGSKDAGLATAAFVAGAFLKGKGSAIAYVAQEMENVGLSHSHIAAGYGVDPDNNPVFAVGLTLAAVVRMIDTGPVYLDGNRFPNLKGKGSILVTAGFNKEDVDKHLEAIAQHGRFEVSNPTVQ